MGLSVSRRVDPAARKVTKVATFPIMKPGYKVGDRVCLVGQASKVGVVLTEGQLRRGKFYYQVFFSATDRDALYPEEALTAHEEIANFAAAFERGQFLDRSTFLQFLILEKIRRPLADNIYTFYASRTDFQVHQFKPVLKFITSIDQRLFLADEVGLGKTIEAGIILTELEARLHGLARVLIACPAALVGKWEMEMGRRFGQIFRVMRRQDFTEFLDRYERYGENEKLRGICTVQMLRSQRILDRISELSVNFDLVIVDESHHMKNPETKSSWLGEVLSENSDGMILLSATPLHLGTQDLFNQLRILAPNDFPDFIFFQDLIEPNQYVNAALRLLRSPSEAAETLRLVEGTSQRERFLNNPNYSDCLSLLRSKSKLTISEAVAVQRQLMELNTLSHVFTRTKRRDIVTEVHFPQREAHVIDINFTGEEMEVYNAVTDWVISRYAHSDVGLPFAKIMPQRQVSSCIPAMKGYLEELIRDGRIRGPREDDGDVIDPEADAEDDSLGKAELAAVRRLHQAVDRVGGQDTKCDQFMVALKEVRAQDPGAKVIVFSFFKRTLDYLLRRLTREGITSALIHGDISQRDRQKRVRQFWDDPDLTVLLSSEVGGEGLDLQVANVMFNYDLPWNPMRVEQRIGRLDRYGQKHEKILIYNFSMRGTIDDIILRKLYGRINIFERYIGDLEAILGNHVNELVREIFNPRLTDDQRRLVAEKIGENLLREKEELERFEKESERFIGQDEFFTREISRIRDTKRFVSAEEVQFLLTTFIGGRCQGTTIRPPKSGRERVFVLKSNEEFRAFVHAYAPDDDAKKEVLRLLAQPQGVMVTFDSQEACKDDSLFFVTMHSPIIKAIVKFTEKGQMEVPLGKLRLNGYKGLLGLHFLFMYLLEKHGAKRSLQLVPILVSARDRNVFYFSDDVTESLLGSLIDAEDLGDEIKLNCQDIEGSENAATDCISLIREEEERKLRRDNEILINNRIESITQALDLKEGRIRRTIEKIRQRKDTDPRIMRLHEGRLRNLRQNTEGEIRKWEERRAVSVGYRRVAAGLLDFA
jgi:superfamily II DNA or RNA helicase